MRPRLRYALVIGAATTAAAMACDLQPQPLPPVESVTGVPGKNGDDNEFGDSPSGSVSDAGSQSPPDRADDGGDASDAGDAGDDGDAATTEDAGDGG